MSYTPDDSYISTDNSTSTLINTGANFTGTWEDVGSYSDVVVAVKTDQNGYFEIQFSPDGTNVDSTLTRYYRTDQIEAPHRFTITRQYFRVIFYNNSGTNQTYCRLQSSVGSKTDLNAPADGALAQDFDSISVRPSNFNYEVAEGLRQGYQTWNKWGYNADIDAGVSETYWSVGGTFAQLTTARTLSIVSTSTADDGSPAGTGANSIVVTGIDANWEEQTEIVTLDGTTPVVTTSTWLGINRMALYLAGTGKTNAGTITATATTDLTVQAEIPIGEGSTQHGFFFVPVGHTALIDWLYITMTKNAGGTQPVLTTTMWVTSEVSNAKYDVFRDYINGDTENHSQLTPSQPFVVGEKSFIEFEGESDQNNTEVSVRFTFILVRDKDA